MKWFLWTAHNQFDYVLAEAGGSSAPADPALSDCPTELAPLHQLPDVPEPGDQWASACSLQALPAATWPHQPTPNSCEHPHVPAVLSAAGHPG